MKTREKLLIGAVSLLIMAGCSPSYTEIMEDAVRNALGKQFGDYEYYDYPTNNFGVGTVYEDENGDNEFSNLEMMCDTWYCLNTSPPDDDEKWLNVERESDTLGYVALGGDGPPITITERRREKVNFTLLTDLFDVIDVEGGFNEERVVSTSIYLGRVYPRVLRQPKWESDLTAGSLLLALQEPYGNGDLITIVADVVVQDFSIRITVDETMSANLDAALAGQTSGNFSNDKVEVAVEQESQGVYTLQATKPVVLAVLPKKQPGPGTLDMSIAGGSEADSSFWKEWVPARGALPSWKSSPVDSSR